MKDLLREHDLHTVCEEARCPNRGECWEQGEATIMILGDTCTRACRFCSVATGRPAAPDAGEPDRVALTVKTLGLSYCVITCVDRDDLPDFGARHWSDTIRAIKRESPSCYVDILTGDFQGNAELVREVARAGADVHAHNIETVRRLTPLVRDKRAGYDQTLAVLRMFKESAPEVPTKTGLQLGHGETPEEVEATMRDLKAAGVDFLTIGQYLQPTREPRHLAVQEWVTPDAFAAYEKLAYEIGFAHCVSGPFVRSSYKAWEIRDMLVKGFAPAMPTPADA